MIVLTHLLFSFLPHHHHYHHHYHLPWHPNILPYHPHAIYSPSSHIYCANNMPGGTRVENGLVLIRQSPKGVSKQKCSICNRKHGLCVQCTHPGCQTYFHPICGERSGRGYARTRVGLITAFCGEHLPDGIERTPGGYWVSALEITRTRMTLDRARLILDAMQRREVFKRQTALIETKLFQSRFKERMARLRDGRVDEEYDSDYTSDR